MAVALKGTSHVAAPAPLLPAAKIRPPTIRALPRERLTDLLSALDGQRLLLVVAPAGSGKTTLLTQLAAAAERPAAWYWAESSDASASAFLEGLERSLSSAIPTLRIGWETADDVGVALETWPGPAPLLMIDDFQVLRGSPSETMLERVLLSAPALRVVIASRTLPNFNLSRLRVSGELGEIGPDELRFRSWEIESLFRDFYGDPLPAEDLALLTRRTEGWAAALQLFHLATRGKHPAQRRRTLARLSTRSKLMREYLVRNVIDELPQHLRGFMLRTCVLGKLSAPICDELLETTRSMQILDELRCRHLLTCVGDDEDEYRYQELLRSHMAAMLVEEVGGEAARSRYRAAGAILENAGALPEALHAFCGAEDWNAVRELLGREGQRLADSSSSWVDFVPSAISRNDPWLLLAAARQRRAAGEFRAALETYREAEQAFGAASASDACRHERLVLNTWLDPSSRPTSDWLGIVRQATMAQPAAVRRLVPPQLPLPERALAAGLAALLAGQLDDASKLLRDVTGWPDASPVLAVAARVANAAADLLSGDRDGVVEAEAAAEAAERLGLSWLARVSRALLALTGRADARVECASAHLAFEERLDSWGSALTVLFDGLGRMAAGDDGSVQLEAAADEFSRLGAAVLAAWARAALALTLARIGHADACPAASRAQAAAGALGVPGARALASCALAEADPVGREKYRRLANASLQEANGLALLGVRQRESVKARSRQKPSPSIVVRCFGEFRMTVYGRPLDLATVKPRVRQMLRLLALHAGRPIHREVLIEALWPEGDPEAANRCLHVAVSSLRRLFECQVGGGRSLISREGEAYRLALPADASVDLVEFDTALGEGRAARARGDTDRTIAAFRSAIDIHHAELLPEEGPAEWLVHERERRVAEACEAAEVLAELLLERGDAPGAAFVCERGLRIDRYRDKLWRLRIASHERAGDPATSLQARREYEHVLRDLGLPSRPSQ